MNPLSERERKELMRLIQAGEPLPEQWRQRLFPEAGRPPEIGKEYRLVYDGKLKREEVLAQTPPSAARRRGGFSSEGGLRGRLSRRGLGCRVCTAGPRK